MSIFLSMAIVFSLPIGHANNERANQRNCACAYRTLLLTSRSRERRLDFVFVLLLRVSSSFVGCGVIQWMPGRRHQKTTGVQSEGWGCRSVSMVTFANYSVFSGGGACHTPQRGADVESSATQPRGGGPQTCVHSAGGRGGERQRVFQHLQVSAQVLLEYNPLFPTYLWCQRLLEALPGYRTQLSDYLSLQNQNHHRLEAWAMESANRDHHNQCVTAIVW